ncbi:MAG: type II toxin-antitoxin system PemK/MazF family toxin [Actinomycetota bacterium]|nr:type II toxin-antitoxin system PemK/MazF family toxin [Actinomycetota bacterium]
MIPSNVFVIAPTSRSARSASFRPEAEINDEPTKVLIEQIGAVDVGRLGKRIGHIEPEEEWEIDDTLHLVLGLR